MKTPIEWAARAKRDLRGVISYLNGHSPRAAMQMAKAVSRQVGRLERFPQSGRIVPGFSGSKAPLRELIIADYRLVYILRNRRAKILTFFHGRRDFLKAIQH